MALIATVELSHWIVVFYTLQEHSLAILKQIVAYNNFHHFQVQELYLSSYPCQ